MHFSKLTIKSKKLYFDCINCLCTMILDFSQSLVKCEFLYLFCWIHFLCIFLKYYCINWSFHLWCFSSVQSGLQTLPSMLFFSMIDWLISNTSVVYFHRSEFPHIIFSLCFGIFRQAAVSTSLLSFLPRFWVYFFTSMHCWLDFRVLSLILGKSKILKSCFLVFRVPHYLQCQVWSSCEFLSIL